MVRKLKTLLSAAKTVTLICTLAILLSMAAISPATAQSEENLVADEKGTPITGTKNYTAYSSEEERLQAMDIKAQSEGYSLYFDSVNGDIAYRHDETGEVYFSSPINLQADSSSETIKQKLASNVRIEYTKIGGSEGEMLSWKDAVADAQIELIPLDKGFRLKYILGREEQRRLLPTTLPASSMEEIILSALEGGDARRIKTYYKKYDPQTTDKTQLDLIKTLYPAVAEMPIYVLKSTTSRENETLEAIMAKTDYTLEQMEKDMAILGAKQEESAIPFFKFYVDYILDGKALVVSLDTQKMTYDNKKFVLRKIAVMEYFMSNQNDEGYFLVPDGSGAIVPFQKEGQPGGAINIPVYSYDTAKTYSVTQDYQQTAALPVFGMKTKKSSLFTEIEEGAENAVISANTRTGTGNFAWISAIFTYQDSEKYGFSESTAAKQSTWEAYDKSAYDGKFSIRYAILGENGDYSKMAEYYRARLLKKEVIKTASGGHSFNMGVIGTVKREERFLLFPTVRNIPLTTFDDTRQMAGDLIAAGVDDMQIRYLGWANGGVENSIFSKANPESVIGGRKGLKALSQFAKTTNIGLYPDAELLYVTQDKTFDGFSPASQGARMLNKQYAGAYQSDLAVNIVDLSSFKYTLGRSALSATYEKFMKSYHKLSLSGLSLGSIASDLNSDKSKENGRRKDYLETQGDVLEKAATSHKIMTEGANLYTLKHSAIAVNFPLLSSGYQQSSYSVPFMAMVLHGSLDYSGNAVNLSGNMHTAFLNAAENGAGLYFEFTMRNSEKLKTTALAHYYSTDFATWKTKATDYWKKLSSLLDGLENESILKHTRTEEGVTVTLYESGVCIYVNYTQDDVTIDGILVPKMDAVRATRTLN